MVAAPARPDDRLMEHPTAITTDIVRDRVRRDRRVSVALVVAGLVLGIATLAFRIDAEHRYAGRQRDAMRRGDLLSYPGEVAEVTSGGESGRDRIDVEYPGPQ